MEQLLGWLGACCVVSRLFVVLDVGCDIAGIIFSGVKTVWWLKQYQLLLWRYWCFIHSIYAQRFNLLPPPSPENYSLYSIRGQLKTQREKNCTNSILHCLGATKWNCKRGKLNTCYDCLSVFLAFLFAINSLRVSAHFCDWPVGSSR